MPFTVVFTPAALEQFSLEWTRAHEKETLLNAEDFFERELRRDLTLIGRHLSEGLWIAHRTAISLFFELSDDDRPVTVTNIAVEE